MQFNQDVMRDTEKQKFWPHYKMTSYYNFSVQDLILKEDEIIELTIHFSSLLLNLSKESGFAPLVLFLFYFLCWRTTEQPLRCVTWSYIYTAGIRNWREKRVIA